MRERYICVIWFDEACRVAWGATRQCQSIADLKKSSSVDKTHAKCSQLTNPMADSAKLAAALERNRRARQAALPAPKRRPINDQCIRLQRHVKVLSLPSPSLHQSSAQQPQRPRTSYVLDAKRTIV